MRSVGNEGIVLTRCPALPNVATLAHQLGTEGPQVAGGLKVIEYIGADKVAEGARYWLRYAGYAKPLWMRGEGADTRLIALSRHESVHPLFCLADSPVASVSDVRGRRIAVYHEPALKLDYNRIIYLEAYDAGLRSAGLTLDDVEEVPFEIDLPRLRSGSGLDYARLQDVASDHVAERNLFSEIAHVALLHLIRGEVDVIAANLPDAVARSLGLRKLYDPRSDRAAEARFDLRCLIASGPLVRERPEALTEVVRRLVRAWRWSRERPTEAVALLARDLRLSPGIMLFGGEDIAAEMRPSVSADLLALLERKKDFLLGRGILSRDVALDAWLDGRFVATAMADQSEAELAAVGE